MPTSRIPTLVPTIPLMSHLVFDPRPRSTTLDRKGDPVWNFWHSLKCWKHFKECRTSSNDGNCRKTPADRRGDAFALFELLTDLTVRAQIRVRVRVVRDIRSVCQRVRVARSGEDVCLSLCLSVRPALSISNQSTIKPHVSEHLGLII